MAWKDPAAKREYERAYYQKNKNKRRAQSAASEKRNPRGSRAEYQRERYADRDASQKARKRVKMREIYSERKGRVRDLKRGRACDRCGYNNPCALEFHHRDPSTKEFGIGKEAWKVSWERLEAEIAKCDLLCSNCHRLEHCEDGRPRVYDENGF